jgi:hypothetical protein
MDQLRWHDLQWCLKRAPRQVLQLMKDHPGKLICSGGFIRDCVNGDQVNDIDLFVTDKANAKLFAQSLSGEAKVHETDNAYTVRGFKISPQIIHRWTFESAEQLTESFDFTVAKAAFWWEGSTESLSGVISGKWQSVCHPDFYADLAARRLIYVSPVREEEPGGSLLRLLKFYQRGYRIPLDSLGAVLARLVMGVNQHEMPMDKGREKGWAKVLTGLLREVDPNVDPTHVSHLPSQSETAEEETHVGEE